MPYFASPRYTAAVDPFLAALLSGATAQDLPHQQSSASKPVATKPCNPTNRSIRAFTPNFDVFETPDAYILEGELPGLAAKKAIDIEFTDDRTLLVRGRIERPAFKSPAHTEAQAVAGTASSTSTITTEERRRSLNPTVEDTDDEDDFSVVSSSKLGEEKTTTKEMQKKLAETKQSQRKAWVSERTFGNFQRMFEFPTSIEVEEVKAELEAGVLRITAPKRIAKGTRKIEIQ